ncbi:nickel-dependent hydrogenase large subunit [Marinobacterium jannaschii]|uniref:nickel-dependent hydrogenase large subunit n=1 Tax=Marinobacterium jannaschii TaxID=64970 RepID=UPI000485E62F|nr:nickel-dependent hydrogenase large subunit [Marinobacterium jannaschii]
MAADLAGRLTFDLQYDGARISDIAIGSSRPYYATRVLQGKTIEQAAAVVPLLFNLCAGAQQVASLQAAEQALGKPACAQVQRLRQALVVAETARELAWRLTKDWLESHNCGTIALLQRWYDKLFKSVLPVLTLAAAEPDEIPDLEEAATQLEQWFESSFGTIATLPQQFCQAQDSSAIGAVILDLEQEFAGIELNPGCAPLPESDPALWLKAFRHSGGTTFVQRPDWQGHCRETSVWTRWIDAPPIVAAAKSGRHPLSLRFMAMVLELSCIPQRLRALCGAGPAPGKPSSMLHPGEGIGIVEAARGRLMHYVKLDQGCVGNYQIVAPTEWNFHPSGSVSAMLKGVEVPLAQVKALVHQTVLAVDPCVGFEINIEVAPHA